MQLELLADSYQEYSLSKDMTAFVKKKGDKRYICQT